MNPPHGPVFESLTRPEWMAWRRRRALAVKYAQERDALPTPAERRAAGREDMPGLCMTGDGELPVRGLLCARCVARPYGATKPVGPDPAYCRRCVTDYAVWFGNGWGRQFVCDRSHCGCECHIGEVVLASA